MVTRIENGVEWEQAFNGENRLASVSDGASYMVVYWSLP